MNLSRAFFGLPLRLVVTAHCGGTPPATEPAGEPPLPTPPRQINIDFQREGIEVHVEDESWFAEEKPGKE